MSDTTVQLCVGSMRREQLHKKRYWTRFKAFLKRQNDEWERAEQRSTQRAVPDEADGSLAETMRKLDEA